ncbi:MAG: hypothetical protein ACFE95_23045 [Candidatus Hodarchaeota archaeon]
MPAFQPPKVKDFYDNRLIVSWEINQPSQLPHLEKLIFRISGIPKLEFDPPQIPQIEIPNLNGNNFMINWVIKKPLVKTKIKLSVQNPLLSEEYFLFFDPKKQNTRK